MLTSISGPGKSFNGSVVKNPPANPGDTGGEGLILGSGKSLKEEMATQSSILAWKILWRGA